LFLLFGYWKESRCVHRPESSLTNGAAMRSMRIACFGGEPACCAWRLRPNRQSTTVIECVPNWCGRLSTPWPARLLVDCFSYWVLERVPMCTSSRKFLNEWSRHAQHADRLLRGRTRMLRMAAQTESTKYYGD